MARMLDTLRRLIGMETAQERADRRWAAEFDRVIADLDAMPPVAPAPPAPPNPDLAREAAEQREEVRAGIGDGLRFGGSFRQVMQEAAVYGIKPEEVEAIRKEVAEANLRLNDEMEKDPEVDLAYIADMLRVGDRLSHTMDEAANRGMTADEVAELRQFEREEVAKVRAAHGFIRPLTRQLVECCRLDAWPGRAAVVDFGLDSSSHLGALQYAIRENLVSLEELDAAMGDGKKLTEIAQRGENPYRFVTFNTAWDRMREYDHEMER